MLETILIIFGIALIAYALKAKMDAKQKEKAFQEFQAEEKRRQEEEEKKKKEKEEGKQFSGHTVNICYGSQSGTAIRLANNLAQELEEEQLKVKIVDLINYEEDVVVTPTSQVFLMLIATHGEGEPTDNCKAFHNYLKQLSNNNKNSDTYKGMQVSVFGLGKSSYEHYNAMGKFFREQLERHGAQVVHPHAEGDDMGSLEDDFTEWKQHLSTAIKQHLLTQKVLSTQHVTSTKNQLIFKLQESSEQLQQYDLDKYEMQSRQYLSSMKVEVKSIKELRQKTNSGSTLHLELLNEHKNSYHTGSNLGIFIENSEETVDYLLQLLQLKREDRISVEQEGSGRVLKWPFPPGSTVDNICRHYVDVQGPLRKKQLKDLATILGDTPTATQLLTLVNDKQLFTSQVEQPQLGLMQLLQQLDIQHLSLKQLIELTTRIAPRLYTISSSEQAHPGQVHITASMSINTYRTGLASTYFQALQLSLQKGQKLYIQVDFRNSNFKLVEDVSLPIIMVGPGAGIAPFRAFLWENQALIQNGKPYYQQMHLYFGCRHKEEDYIYQQELQEFINNKALASLHCAFSRDQEERVYVQHLLQKNKDEVYRMIKDNGRIYICGNTQMGKDVSKVLVEIFQEKEDKTLDEAQKQVSLMEENKLLIKELWG